MPRNTALALTLAAWLGWPERPARLKTVTARLEQSGLTKRCTIGTYQPLTAETVSKVHKPSVANSAKQLAAGSRVPFGTLSSIVNNSLLIPPNAG